LLGASWDEVATFKFQSWSLDPSITVSFRKR
jgi:hypothetical protein